jgi:hypothetical protein
MADQRTESGERPPDLEDNSRNKMDTSTTELISVRSTLRQKFIYACLDHTFQLIRMNLVTGKQSSLQIPGFSFKYGCRWSELPGGKLLITGGVHAIATRGVVKIDTLRECAVSSLPPMHTARHSHAAVYHSQYLYVLGGDNDRDFRECERYACAESRWEVLPSLPVAGVSMVAVELENSVYVLGGWDGSGLDTVQKLSLDSLTWELMQLKLPQAASLFPCFKTDTEVYLVIEMTLYSFTPLRVEPIKTVPQGLRCETSYYSRGTLYYSWRDQINSLAVGELA